MTLHWIKCQGEVWCKLNLVDLAHRHFDNLGGVYVIWHGGDIPATVYVGQAASFRSRFGQHRKDPSIQRYANLGLYVTWSSVDPLYLNGVERYLGEQLKPKVGKNWPQDPPIPVTLPW